MTPVILDTDIGTDIDDTWALALLLRSPELKLEAVVASHGDVRYRALLAAKFLEVAGRSDVPVAEGVGGGPLDARRRGQAAWLKMPGTERIYAPEDYPGDYRTDGARLMADAILGSDEPVTVLSIGPASTVASALALEPRIAANARFVGMHGAIRRGYRGSSDPVPEYNVVQDAAAFRAVLAADWPVTLTPLDTCGTVVLRGDDYAKLRDADGVLMQAVMENYRAWASVVGAPDLPEQRSTTLFDTVAVYLAIVEDLLEMEAVRLGVGDDGLTFESDAGAPVRAAMRWRDQAKFNRWLIDRLL